MDRNPGKRYILSKPPAGMLHKPHMEQKLTNKHPNIGGKKGRKEKKEGKHKKKEHK